MAGWQQEQQARDEWRRSELLRRPTSAALHHVRLQAPRPDHQLVTASPGPDGNVYALWSSAEGVGHLTARTTLPGGASFADPRPAETVAGVVSAHGAGHRVVATLPHLGLAHPTVQPLPGGQVLLVGARARWRPEGPDRNAVVVGADGETLFAATLGDGIAHVQATPSGRVWVGYFDEGVYGNYGWGHPGPAPIGWAGIVCFGPDLAKQWEFPSHVDSSWGSVDDCYALNVVGEVAWSCYYSDFPIVRTDGRRVAGWSNPVSGAGALAVTEDGRVLLAGGYGAERDRLVEGRLAGETFEVVSESRLTLPDDVDLPRGAVVTGRGPDLFVIVGRDCYRLSLA